MPVDLYVGGAEHAVLHLLYARFWHKVLYDLGLVHTKEPFQKLVNQGMILGYSYRYYDDNLADDRAPRAALLPELRGAQRGRAQRRTPRPAASVKARWLPRTERALGRDGRAAASRRSPTSSSSR